MKFITAAALSACLAAAACATPKVVDEQKVGDEALSCEQLAAEIEQAQRYEEEARDERGVTGTNVAAALFFWPALLVTASNTQDAIDAAEERQDHLAALLRARGC